MERHCERPQEQEYRALRRLVRIGTCVQLSVDSTKARSLLAGRVTRNTGAVIEARCACETPGAHLLKVKELRFTDLLQFAPIWAPNLEVDIDVRCADSLLVRFSPTCLLSNRRIALRADFALPIRVRTLSPESYYIGETVNISGGGARLRLGESLDVAQAIEVELNMPDSDGGILQSGGYVVWSRREDEEAMQTTCGVQFVGLDQPALKRLCRMTLRKLALDQRFAYLGK